MELSGGTGEQNQDPRRAVKRVGEYVVFDAHDTAFDGSTVAPRRAIEMDHGLPVILSQGGAVKGRMFYPEGTVLF